MDQVTRNAPFGTDNTPLLEYKIIGGKRVEVVAKSFSKQNKKRNLFGYTSPELGPHGTPPMQTQPLYREYEYGDLLKGYNTAQQHELARKVASYTSPFGDRTQSFRHGVPKLNKHSVLPPIGGVSQTAGNNVCSDFNSATEIQNDDKHVNSEDVSLESLVSQKLKTHPTHKISLKDMYIELSSFDRELTGYVNENQLSLVILRHDLPLKLSTLKILYNKFTDPKDRRMISYERFLRFLSSCLAQSNSDEELNVKQSASESRILSRLDNPSDKAASVKAGITNLLMTCTVDSKLVTMIKEQLSGSDEWDLAQLYTTLNRSDRLRNNQLSADVIMNSCVSERVPLTSAILTNMLQQAEIDHGNVDWRQFLAPLACAYLQLYPERDLVDSNVDINQIDSRKTDTVIHSPSSQRAPSSKDDNSSTSKVSRIDHLSAGWDEREPRGSKNPLATTKSDQNNPDQPNTPVRDVNWVRNFSRLTHALKSYNPYKTDQLPRPEVERMINNYNLIYGLGFSTVRLTEAVKRSIVKRESKENESSEFVSINSLLSILMAAH